MPLLGKILWAILLGLVVFVFVMKFIGKRQYKGEILPFDPEWYEKSQQMYPEANKKRAYYFHYDKNFFSSGHVMEDRNNKIIYEAKFLYNNVTSPDEVDFVNHIINYTHHHKVGHTKTSSVGGGHSSVIVDSTFSFDGVDVFKYLEEKGYDYKFNIHGLAYTIDIMKDGQYVAKLYSSNNGKNYFNADGPIEAKIGGNGLLVVETDYANMDAAFIYAIVFARTELSSRNL